MCLPLLLKTYESGLWHMDCLLPSLATISIGTWKCPLCTPHNPLQQHETFATPPPLSIPTPIKTKVYPAILRPHYWNTHNHLPMKNCALKL